MGSFQSTLSIESLNFREEFLELEKWDISRVNNIITAWRPDPSSIQTDALTREELSALLMKDFDTVEDDDETSKDPTLKFIAWAESNPHKKQSNEDQDRSSVSSIESASSSSSGSSSASSSGGEAGDMRKSRKKLSQRKLQLYLAKFQAVVRRRIDQKNVRELRQYLNLRDETYFEGKTGPERLDRMFSVFCESCQCLNPFDGRRSVDALQVMVSLILLSKGTCKQKTEAVFRLFAVNGDELTFEEVVVKMIIITRSLSNIFQGTENLFSPGEKDEELEALSESAMGFVEFDPVIAEKARLDFAQFYRWSVTSKFSSPWLGRLCSDVRHITIPFLGMDCGVLICQDLPNCYIGDVPPAEPSIALIRQGDGGIHQKIGAVYTEQLRATRGFVFQATGSPSESIYLQIDGGTGIKSARIYLGEEYVTFSQIPNEVTRGVPCSYGFDFSSEYKWSKFDGIGVFDTACPTGCQGAYSIHDVHRAVMERRETPITDFPESDERLICFKSDDCCEYVDFRTAGVAFLTKHRADKYRLEPDIPLVTKVDIENKQSCPHSQSQQVTCGCRWVLGRFHTHSHGKLRILVENMLPEEDENHQHDEDEVEDDLGEFSFPVLADDENFFLLRENVEWDLVPNHGDKVLVRRKKLAHFHEGVVKHSGWLELRYIQHASDDTNCVGVSNKFWLTRCPLELRRLHGGDIEDDIICEFDKVDPDYLKLVEDGDPLVTDDFIGLYPCDVPHGLEPWGSMKLPVTTELLQQQNKQVKFDPYYFHCTKGGMFEARFVQPGLGRLASVSSRALLTPVTFIHDSYAETGFEIKPPPQQVDQKLVCQFEIVDPAVWTVWDRIELCKQDDDSIVDYCYVTAHRRTNNRASMSVPDELHAGEYYWRYHGQLSETRCRSKVFQVTTKTVEAGEEELMTTLSPENMELRQQEEEEKKKNSAAVRVQCWARQKLARVRHEQRKAELEEAQQELQREHAKTKIDFDKISKANARRNPTLISKKDKAKENKLKALLVRQGEQISLLHTKVPPEVLEQEREKVETLRREARETRERLAAEEAMRIEQCRRTRLRKTLAIRRDPFLQPIDLSRRRGDKTCAKATSELAEWVADTNGLYEDDEFIAETESLFCGCGSYPCQRAGPTARLYAGCGWMNDLLEGQGAVFWKRFPEVFPETNVRKNHVFPSHINLRKIGCFQRLSVSGSLMARLEPFHAALWLCAEHGSAWMSGLIDLNHADMGLFAVKVFYEGKWVNVIVDDRIPCVQNGDIEEIIAGRVRKKPVYVPLFSSCDVDAVGLWVYVVEKAMAKLYGSYEIAFGRGRLVQEWMSVFTGGIVATFHNDSNPGLLQPFDETWNDPHPTFNVLRDDNTVTLRPIESGNVLPSPDIAEAVLSKAVKGCLSKHVAHCFVTAFSPAPQHGVSVLVLDVREVITLVSRKKVKSEAELAAELELKRQLEEEKRKQAEAEEERKQKKLEEKRLRESRRTRKKTTRAPIPRRTKKTKMKKNVANETEKMAAESQQQEEAQEQSEGAAQMEMVEMPVTLIRLRKLLHKEDERECRSWQWTGDWCDDSDLWTDDVIAQMEGLFDPIDDGTFWMSITDFFKYFSSWGYCMDFRQDVSSAETTCVLKFNPSGGVRQPWAETNPVLEIASSVAVQEIFVQVETDGLDARLGEVRLLQVSPRVENCACVLARGVRIQSLMLANSEDTDIYRVQGQLGIAGLSGTCSVRIVALGTRRKLKVKYVNAGSSKICALEMPQRGGECFPCRELLPFTEENHVLKQGYVRFHGYKSCKKCSICKELPYETLVVDYSDGSFTPSCRRCWVKKFGTICPTCDVLGPPSLMPPKDELLPKKEEEEMKEAQLKLQEGMLSEQLVVQEEVEPSMVFTLATVDRLLNNFPVPSSILDVDGNCDSCFLRASVSNAPKCDLCHVALLNPEEIVMKRNPVKGAQVPLHQFCVQKFVECHAPKCGYCNGPLCCVPDKFTGEVKKTRLGVVHDECFRPACAVKRK